MGTVFSWSILLTIILLLLSLPVLAEGNFKLILFYDIYYILLILFDRNLNITFFDPIGGMVIQFHSNIFLIFGQNYKFNYFR